MFWLKGNSLELPRCPHCNVDNPNIFATSVVASTANHLGQEHRYWKAFACRRCGGAILAGARSQEGEVTELYPNADNELEHFIPLRAREYLEQARNSIHAPAGAVMLAASAVDSMLKEKGYKDGSLYQRIEKAAAEHLITEGMAQWAHQVRLDANDQRHADDAAPLPNPNDARQSLEFVFALAQFLYVLPAKVSKGIEESKS